MKRSKMILALALGAAMLLALGGCGGTAAPEETPVEAPAEIPAEETAVKPVLLAVSFGTSYNDSRDVTIGAVEKALETAYPDYEVRRAFTSQIIIDILAERENLVIDNVTEAMERLVADGVKNVVVQPTHVMSGYEYDDVVNEVNAYADQFDSLTIGAPLLTSDEDYTQLVSIITEATAAQAEEGAAVVYMGHGTEHEANSTYAKLQQALTDAGYDKYFIGTVEAAPTLEDVLSAVEGSGAEKVVLRPLMIVAGDHANNDMAGDEPDSWKSAFTAAGYEVECVLEGLGQLEGVQQMYVAHAGAAMAG